MLTEVGDVDLADVPQLEPVRKKLLERAGNFYEKFLARRGQDPSLRFLAGRAYSRLGDIQALLGEHKKAENSYQEACRLLQSVAQSPQQRDLELARTYRNWGNLLKKLGRYPEAQKALQESLQRLGQLAADSPNNADYQKQLANSYHDLGTVLARLPDQIKLAFNSYQRALKLQKYLSQSNRKNPQYRKDWAQTMNNLGILISPYNLEEAWALFKKAINLQKDLVANYPQKPAYKRQLARTYNNLANLLIEKGRSEKGVSGWAEAKQFYRKGLQLLEQLTRDYPSNPTYRQETATLYHNLGLRNKKLGKYQDALVQYQQALHHRRELVHRFPEVPEYRYQLALIYVRIGMIPATRPNEAKKNYQAALELLQPLAKPLPEPKYQNELAKTLTVLAQLQGIQSERFRFLVDTDLDRWLIYSAGFGFRFLQRKALLTAREYLVEAIDVQERACQGAPDHPKYREDLLTQYQLLAMTELQLRDHVRASQALQKMPLLAPNNVDVYEVAVIGLAGCMKLVDFDSQLSKDQRDKQRHHYESLALEFLQTAIDKGFDRARFLQSQEIQPLHGNPQFQKLLERLKEGKARVG